MGDVQIEDEVELSSPFEEFASLTLNSRPRMTLLKGKSISFKEIPNGSDIVCNS